MENKLDTHFYDGKLGARLKPYRELLEIQISHEEKTKYFDLLKQSIKNPFAMHAIELIINDLAGNHDPTNNLKADIILFLICKKIFDSTTKNLCYGTEIPFSRGETPLWREPERVNSRGEKKHLIDHELLELQLADIITSGRCAQGRCTRLAQIFFILYEQ